MKCRLSVLLVVAPFAALWADTPGSKSGDALGHQLGTIRFEVSGSEAARTRVIRGVKLLHHMMYIEADREFAAAAEADPTCVLAYWGRAMTIIHPLWPDVPDAAELNAGGEFVRTALARGPRTPRERAYLRPLEAYFVDPAQRDLPSRLKAADAAWQRVAEEYPADLDAAAFSALFHLAPARFLPKDKSHRIQLEAGATIQKILAQLPDHPGAQHYKIHAYDFPLLADRALEICDTYVSIAPAVPHALHMPTHIYTRRGQWEKSIEFNLRSGEAARKQAEASGTMNSHLPHALDYLAYAYLQLGQYGAADAIRRQVAGFRGPFDASGRLPMAFALAAIPARCALERRDWEAAARIEVRSPAAFPWGDTFLNCDAIVRYARALGAARAGQVERARQELAELESLRARLAARTEASYWASQAETQVLAVRAWLAARAGETEPAVALLRRATELELGIDKEAVTPGEVLPAGDQLGDLLLELGRPREARAAFESVLQGSPNRLNTLHGAARAAERDGDRAAARTFFEAVVAVAGSADPECEPLRDARRFLR